MEMKEYEEISKSLVEISTKINNKSKSNGEKMILASSLIVGILEKIEITNDEKSRILTHLNIRYLDGEI